MDTLAALVAGFLDMLRGTVAPAVCPGSWAWAVTMLGVGVGLLPTVGTIAVAAWRKRIGSRYGALESAGLVSAGVLSCGVLPLVVFVATGHVFALAAGDGAVPGLGTAATRNLSTAVCVAGRQDAYLGEGSVADAFDPADPVRFGIAVVLLGFVPIVAAMLVAAQARLALRRGPSWPARFFWVPVLGVAVATAGSPAGATEHLWVGVVSGALLGVVPTALAGAPSREVVARSLAPTPPGRPLGERMAERFRRREPQPVAVPLQNRGRPAAPVPSSPVPSPGTPGGPPSGRSAAGPAPAPVPPGTATSPVVPPARSYPPTLLAGAAAGPLSRTLPRGQQRFHPIRRIGSGGFGRVLLARDAKLGTTVALKAAHAPDAETEQRIQREAGALAAIRHPNCVRILDLVHARSDAGLAGLDGMVIVMEYVQGMSLGELVQQRGPLDDVAAARVWSAVAGALHAAHTRGVLHRDVKPGNVIVDPAGVAHLIDFGIARRTGDSTLTMAGYVLGTPDYLAPEVAAGKPASPASDAWQLAATVSYALSGFPPRGGHPDAVSSLRAAAAGAKLTHLPRRSAHLALLKSAMRTDPARRPDLPTTHRSLDDWLRRNGVAADAGPLTATTR